MGRGFNPRPRYIFLSNMFLVIHSTAGMIIGQAVQKPVWSFIIGFIVHFIFDIIPHGDSGVYNKYKNGEMRKRAMAIVTVDSILTILWVLWSMEAFTGDIRRSVTAGIAGSVLPDLLVGLSEAFKKRNSLQKFQKFHIRIHNLIVEKIHRDWPWIIGVTFQMAILLILINFAKN